MKKLALCFLILLAACIPVEDLRVYWAKGVIDMQLFGSWRLEKVKNKGVIVSQINDMYEIDSEDGAERLKDDYKPIFARVLHTGDGSGFLMMVDDPHHVKSGTLVRYKITEKDFFVLSPIAPAVRGWLSKHNAEMRNIKIDDSVSGGQISIATLDDATFKLFSDIPQGSDYWETSQHYVRQLVKEPKAQP